MRLIHAYGHGVPQIVNTLCDTRRVYGFASQAPRNGGETMLEVSKVQQATGLFPAKPSKTAVDPVLPDLSHKMRQPATGKTSLDSFSLAPRRSELPIAHGVCISVAGYTDMLISTGAVRRPRKRRRRAEGAICNFTAVVGLQWLALNYTRIMRIWK